MPNADAFLDNYFIKRQAVHVGIALNLSALHVEAFALGCLSDRTRRRR
jgi:hypothetical protein